MALSVPQRLANLNERITLLITTTRHQVSKARNQIHFNNKVIELHMIMVSIKQAFRYRLIR